jgi:hypothetical protein
MYPVVDMFWEMFWEFLIEFILDIFGTLLSGILPF